MVLFRLRARKGIDQSDHSWIERRTSVRSGDGSGHVPKKENCTHRLDARAPNLDTSGGDFQTRLVGGGALSPAGVAFSRESIILGSKSKRMDQRSKSVSLPSEDTLNAARKGLPFFESYDTRKLLADAAKANNGIASDAAITAMYNQHCRAQLVQLLRALGCDPKDKQFWPKALIKLATLHHNLGRLVHRQSSRRTAKTWTAQDESILLCGVYELVQTGLSEREAVRTIADAKVFPHYERRPWQRPSGQATRSARQAALWRKYQRVRERSKGPDSLARQLGIGVTDFEMFLTGLGLPAPSTVNGDKGRARKRALL